MSRQFSIYTPSLHEIDDLEARLVGAKRRHAARTVATVRKSVLDGGCHHFLFVGSRGIGKTHLVSVCFHRLRNDDELRPRVALAWIREEHYGIASAADLFRRVIEAVKTDNPGAEIPDGPSSEAVLRALTRDRHVVVFAENLDDLFRRIGPHGQQALRAVIEETAAVSLVATTPSLFPGVSDAESPFYGTFDTSHIDEMSLYEATELLLRVAELRGDDDLVAALRRPETRRRLEVIEALAGGHPRIWMLFADSLTVGAIDDLVPLFLKMLDDLTPYYQDRMRDLEGDQERIVALLCDQLGALSVGEIADRCEIEHRVASTAVGRLETKGFLRRAPQGGADRRRAYYELREPLLRLCLQVKEARGKPVQLIVDFLRAWYDPAEVWSLLAEVPTRSLAIEYLRAAFLNEPPTIDALASIPPADAELRMDGLVKAYPDLHWLGTAKAIYTYLGGDAEGALALLEDARDVPALETLRLVVSVRADRAKGQQAIEQLHVLVDDESTDPGSLFLAGLALEDLDDQEGALTAYTRARHSDPGVEFLADAQGRALHRLARFEEAVRAFDEGRRSEDPSLENRRLRCCTLLELERFDEALAESQALVAAAPEFGGAHALFGAALLALDRAADAFAALDKAGRLDPSLESVGPLWKAALSLLLRTTEEPGYDGVSRLNAVVAANPDLIPMRRVRAEVLRSMGRLTEGRSDLEYAVALDPRDAVLRYELAAIELELDNWDGFRATVRQGHDLVAGDRVSDTAPYCRLTMSRPDRVPELIKFYELEGALGELGQGLVLSISSLVDPGVDAGVAVDWLRAWEEAGAGHDELVIPLRILAAAVAWRVDGDDAHLLRLPAEERAVLEPMLRGSA